MPRFWTQLVDSLPREMKNLTWRVPLVLAVVVLAVLIFFPFQDTPYATKTVEETYKPGKGGEKYGRVDPDARVTLDYEVTNRRVWLTSPFHYQVEREIAAEELPAEGGRARKKRTLEIRAKGLSYGLDLRGGTELLYRIELDKKTKESVSAADIKEVIQKRIDAYGLREPRIQVQGSDRILIQLPGQEVAALETIKGVIQNIGHLEFRLVASSTSQAHKAWQRTGEAPPGYQEYVIPSLKEGEEEREKILVSDRSEMTGEYIRGTRVVTGGAELRPTVGLSFSPEGRHLFARVTNAHVKERLAIILNTRRDDEGAIASKGMCYSAPVIEERIFGDAVIRGDFDIKDAKALRTVLMAGSLPAPLRLEHEKTVGATLGPALVSKGRTAIVVGLLAVVAFMALYYWLAGLVADFALVLNILIIVAVMILFDATLTLPGIAGLLLTVGMSVDANVLIFERVREEQGGPGDKPLRLAIRDGYGRAFWTIFDANLTTLLTALILYWIGTGAVKGFAVVLSIGILTSMFTALVVTRVVFDLLTWRRKLNRLPMAQLVKRPQLGFMRLRNRFLIASGIVIAAGLAVFISRGEDNWDIDFRGGTLLHIVFRDLMDADEIGGRLQAAGPEFAGCEVQSVAEKGVRLIGRRSREFVVRIPSLSEAVIHRIEPILATTPGTLEVDVRLHAPLKPERMEAALAQTGGYTAAPTGEADAEGRHAAYRIAAPVIEPDPVRTALEAALAAHKPEGQESVFAAFTPGEPKVNYLARADVEIDRPVPLDEIEAALLDTGGRWHVEPNAEAEGEGRYRRFLIESDAPNTRLATTRIDRAFAKQTLASRIQGVFADELAPPDIETLGQSNGRTTLAINLAEPVALDALETKLAAWELDAAASDPAGNGGGLATRFQIDVATDQAEQLTDILRKDTEAFPLSNPVPRVEKVGSAVAKEMLAWALVAIAAASLIIIAYVWLRFERFKYGIAAVAALIHDVLITVGLLALFGRNFNLPIVAAILTIIGYSINDTIVVFDRIRENLRRHRRRDADAATIDESINQVLSRTLLTSFTTLIAVLSLLLFAGGVIQDFALTLLIGVIVGTYSSVFIASPILILHQEQIEKRLARGRRTAKA